MKMSVNGPEKRHLLKRSQSKKRNYGIVQSLFKNMLNKYTLNMSGLIIYQDAFLEGLIASVWKIVSFSFSLGKIYNYCFVTLTIIGPVIIETEIILL